MKTIKWLLVVAIVCGLATSCKKENKEEVATQTETAQEAQPDTYLAAIERYMVDSIGVNYTQGDVCIPFYKVVAADEANKNDIQVWGDFWVDNFELAGDTLKTVSGGNHPGLFHVKGNADGSFEVTKFDAVADGSDYQPSAQRVFGDKFADFQKVNSDEKAREQLRLETVANYVKSHDLKVLYVKDFGWPEISLPQVEE